MNKKTRHRHLGYKTVFCSIQSKTTLARLLKVDQRKLNLLAEKPQYRTFTIPKKGGGEREIEAPSLALKNVLSRLNRFLQSVYYLEKSSASYGFIVGVKNDEDRRNILTNAYKHAGKPYLLSVDLRDFFHTVTREKIIEIFAGKPFNFKRDLPELLADLTTFKGRLPMGTPTSPVLSNFACRKLDEELVQFADSMLWRYTRYVDDMSFSSKQRINAEMMNSVRDIIRQSGFVINPLKTKVYGPKEAKIITGLLVTEKVSLAPDYLPSLKEEITRLKQALIIQNEQGQLSTKWIEQYQQRVRGRLSFAGFVLRRDDEQLMQLKDEYYIALNPPQEEFGAVSWRGFPYNM